MSLSSSGIALPARVFLAVYISIVAGGVVWADRYSFNESGGSWSDPENWQNADPEGDEGPPGGDDEAVFAINTTVNVDSSVAVGWLDVIQGDTTLALGGNSLSVLNLRQFRIASGNEASVTLTPGAVSSNGMAVGMSGKGTLTIPSGAAVSDSNEIDVGYTDEGTLQLTGGLVESKRVFLGSFASGNGTAEVSNAATLRANTDYIVVGNLGGGTLKVSDGGKAEAPRVIVGSFAGSHGEATITGGSSRLNAQTHLHVGFNGMGKLTIDEGAKATTNVLRLGDHAGSNGELHITGSGSTVDVGQGGAYFGPAGMSHSRIASGGKLNVAGGGPIHLGGESTGNGVLNIEGQGSTLNAPDSRLEIGKEGVGQLHLSGGAALNVKEILMEGGAGKTSQLTLGSQTSVQLPSDFVVHAHGTAEVQITGSSQLSARAVKLDSHPDGQATVMIQGGGSTLRSNQALDLGLFAGSTSRITIDQGGKVVAPAVSIGREADSYSYLFLDGAASKLESPELTVGRSGVGELTLRNGATYTAAEDLHLGRDASADGTIRVIGGGSHLRADNRVHLGLSGSGGLFVHNQGQATLAGELTIGDGILSLQNGGSVTLNQAALMEPGSEQMASVELGGGSNLTFQQIDCAGGTSEITVSGSTMTGDQIAAVNGTAGQRTVAVHGGRLQVNKLVLQSVSDKLTVTAGGHVWAVSTLNMGRGDLALQGGSVDVGFVFPPTPELGYVRVGHGGVFYSDRVVPNVRDMGGLVQTRRALTVSGNYLQDAGGVLGLYIGGTTAGTDHSQLAVAGDLQLSGTIRIAFQDGFTPQPGQTFDLITVNGAAQLNSPQIEIGNLAPGFAFDFAPFNGGYRLTALSAGEFVPPQPGDFNADGVVDGYDLISWEANFGLASGATNEQGDADADGDVDGADFLSWQRRIRQSPNATAAAAPIPEPGAGLLFGLALASVRSFRPNRRFCRTV